MKPSTLSARLRRRLEAERADRSAWWSLMLSGTWQVYLWCSKVHPGEAVNQ